MNPASDKNLFTRSILNAADTYPESKLGAAVITTAMSDIQKGIRRTKMDGEQLMHYRSAIDFLTKPNHMLDRWCDIAGLEPEYVIRMANLQIKHIKKE